MAGKIRDMIDSIIDQRSKGNPTLKITTGTKLLIKGIDSSKYTKTSPDDPEMIERVRLAAGELGITLR
jgi:hypothetical protein